MLLRCLCLCLLPLPAVAATCQARFQVQTEADHGTLPSGTMLDGQIDYDDGTSMRLGAETVSYLSAGRITVTAPDGTGVTGTLRAIHLTRTPHFADYASFDAKDVVGNLGEVTAYEDPMLVTLFAPRGSLTSFDLPRDTKGWRALKRRRVFQVHTPDTMWTLPGAVIGFDVVCKE